MDEKYSIRPQFPSLIFTLSLSSISPKIDGSVKKMGRLLQEVRGGGQGQAISKSEVAAAADGILGPLMDLLDGETDISRVSQNSVVIPQPFRISVNVR